MPLLALDHARLRFGGIVALDDVSLEVAEGSISASGAIARAVSSVRGSPLVITRSKRMPRSASPAARACSRPSSVSVTSCGWRPWK